MSRNLDLTVVKITRRLQEPDAPWIIRSKDHAFEFMTPGDRLPLFVRKKMETTPKGYFEAHIDGQMVSYTREIEGEAW